MQRIISQSQNSGSPSFSNRFVIEGYAAQKVSAEIPKNLDYNLTASEVQAVNPEAGGSSARPCDDPQKQRTRHLVCHFKEAARIAASSQEGLAISAIVHSPPV